jgi:Nuclease-related domain/UvrD-like helicase C-terminal domain
MRMIPDQVSSATQSNAERQLFRWLSLLDDPDWSYALHSLNLAEHPWKRMGEIDFLLVGPRGIYVLEVKGGHVSREQGVWQFTNRSGRVNRKRESPFSQAKTAMFALQEKLEKLMPRGLLSRVTFGYAVVFPDLDFDIESVEWDREMVINRGDLDRKDGVRRSLGRMSAYWKAKPGGRNVRLDSETISAILTYLRPDFDVVPTLSHLSAAAEAELAQLTVNQYRALDANSRNPRIIFEGGAGTGKTVLAVEIARRERNRGNRPLYTCRSSVMTGFVAGQPDMSDIVVLPLQRISAALGTQYDSLVLDEGQDAINFQDLAVIDQVLRGGLDDGRWFILLDSNNQRGLVGSYEPDAMSYLRSFRPTEVILTDNCRNTRQIVLQTRQLTGADVGISTAGTGPEVRIVHASSPVDASAAAADYLNRLESDGVPPGEITLLSGVGLKDSIFERLPAYWRLRIDMLDLNRVTARSASRVGFATIAEFKGLESRFVLLSDVGSPGQPGYMSNLYVGMTRARVGLWLVLDEQLRGGHTPDFLKGD